MKHELHLNQIIGKKPQNMKNIFYKKYDSNKLTKLNEYNGFYQHKQQPVFMLSTKINNDNKKTIIKGLQKLGVHRNILNSCFSSRLSTRSQILYLIELYFDNQDNPQSLSKKTLVNFFQNTICENSDENNLTTDEQKILTQIQSSNTDKYILEYKEKNKQKPQNQNSYYQINYTKHMLRDNITNAKLLQEKIKDDNSISHEIKTMCALSLRDVLKGYIIYNSTPQKINSQNDYNLGVVLANLNSGCLEFNNDEERNNFFTKIIAQLTRISKFVELHQRLNQATEVKKDSESTNSQSENLGSIDSQSKKPDSTAVEAFTSNFKNMLTKELMSKLIIHSTSYTDNNLETIINTESMSVKAIYERISAGTHKFESEEKTNYFITKLAKFVKENKEERVKIHNKLSDKNRFKFLLNDYSIPSDLILNNSYKTEASYPINETNNIHTQFETLKKLIKDNNFPQKLIKENDGVLYFEDYQNLEDYQKNNLINSDNNLNTEQSDKVSDNIDSVFENFLNITTCCQKGLFTTPPVLAIGDGDGSFVRKFLSAMASGHVKLNSEYGFKLLIKLMIAEACAITTMNIDIRGSIDKDILLKFQESKDIYTIQQEIMSKNTESTFQYITFQEGITPVINMGDCVNDRFTNNRDADLILTQELTKQNSNYTQIMGNHDWPLNNVSFLNNIQFGVSAKADKNKPTNQDLKTTLFKCYKFAHYENNRIYLHHGFSLLEHDNKTYIVTAYGILDSSKYKSAQDLVGGINNLQKIFSKNTYEGNFISKEIFLKAYPNSTEEMLIEYWNDFNSDSDYKDISMVWLTTDFRPSDNNINQVLQKISYLNDVTVIHGHDGTISVDSKSNVIGINSRKLNGYQPYMAQII